MPQRTELHGSALMLVRRLLDEFCEDHGMALSDANAVEVARHLIALAVSENEEPEAMRRNIEDWFSRSHPPRASS
ncbi:hypothetical protein [Agrobacterium tumefaciens]|uniref:hypothetical protein n=1 Tax=Agrobacterium tumefaciens TaxID=358 RepID=UPI0021FD231C|nr:hypothetical protein FY131_27230 [Agrobacterium tumefaciens]